MRAPSAGSGPRVPAWRPAAALVGWLVGVPVLLMRWGGWPLDDAPGWGWFADLPLPPAVDWVLVGVLGIALWGAWGQLVWGVLVAVAAHIGGREPAPGAEDPIRRLAQHLVRSVVGPVMSRTPGSGPGATAVQSAARQDHPADAQATSRGGGTALVPAPVAPPSRPVPAQPAAGDGHEVRRLSALLAQVEVLVKVLGDVQAVHPAPPGSATGSRAAGERLVPVRQKALEALAYLALSDAGVSRPELEAVVFPGGAGSQKVMYDTVRTVLKLAGDQPSAAATGRHFVLSERVVTDYGIFSDLAGQAARAGDAEIRATLLGEALDLVQGEPFSGVSRSYGWAGAHRALMVDHVVEVAEELAEIRLARADWLAAEDAARRGLRASPTDERMYRMIMRTTRVGRNAAEVRRVFDELCTGAAGAAGAAGQDGGIEPTDALAPETVALFQELTARG